MRAQDFDVEPPEVEPAERLRRLAVVAADLVVPGMLVGLGTGSTADAVIRELGHRVARGLRFTGVATSNQTASLARELGIPLTTLDDVDRIDLGIDGADEIDPQLDAIKGRGGALLREKLVALACDDYVLVASTEKSVDQLGTLTPLPVEIVACGWEHTARRLEQLRLSPRQRKAVNDRSRPWVTDSGGMILDCEAGPIDDPIRLSVAVKTISGVVEHGLFLGVARAAIQVNAHGHVVRRERPLA